MTAVDHRRTAPSTTIGTASKETIPSADLTVIAMGDRRRLALVGRGDRPALGESAAAETLRRFDDQAVDALPQRADLRR